MMDEFELLKNLPTIGEREWSFLETIGVSQKERILAQMLAYFFNTEEKHGLKDSFIKGLLFTKPRYLKEKKTVNCANELFVKQEEYYYKLKKYNQDSYTFNNSRVHVEVETFNQNRIDIVIETDDLVIAIEFKINDNLDNPLNDYANFIKCKNDKGEEINSYKCNKYKGKDKYFVVLTPYWKEPGNEAKKNEEFVQITIAGFLENVKKIVVGNDFFKGNENSHQFYIYTDFINTIENRGKEITMINEYFKSFNQNGIFIGLKSDNKKEFSYEILEKTYKNLRSVKKYIEDQMDKLMIKLSNNEKLNKFNFSIVDASKDRLDSAITTRLGNGKELKIRLSLKGWSIELYDKDAGELEQKYIEVPNNEVSNNIGFDRIEEEIRNCYKEWLTKNTSSDIRK